jgi:hypothetical protein
VNFGYLIGYDLLLNPNFSWVPSVDAHLRNRFKGFSGGARSVETVKRLPRLLNTSLK